MKYGIEARVFGFFFSKMLKKYYKENIKTVDINYAIKNVKKEYKAIIARTPDIGEGNILASNLTGASYFFAMAKKVPGMTPKLMDKIVDDVMHSKTMLKMHAKCREQGLLFTKEEQEKWAAAAKRSETSPYEYDWKFTYTPGNDEFYYNYTKCGVCKLAEQEDLLDYLPCMCKMDYPKFEMKGAKLYRTKTLANGDECCDFHVVRIKDNE